MKKLFKKIIGVCCVVATVLASANYVAEMSLDEKVSASDLVVVGKIVSTHDKKNNGASRNTGEYSTVQIEIVLKGDASGSVEFLSRGLVSELNPDCCKVGEKYLFFLERINEGKFASVNGRYGVYLISDKKTEGK